MKKYFLFFLFYTHLSAKTVLVPDLSAKSIEVIRDYQSKHPGPLMIKVEGEKSIFQTAIEYGEAILGKTDVATGKIDNLGLLKPMLQWAFGGTIASYSAGFYLIYRAYKLLRTIGSWTFAASKGNEEELVLYIRKTQTKALQQDSLQKLRQEKDVLEKYLTLHIWLCRWRIRKLFLFNKSIHRSIVKSYKRLCALERKLCKNEK